MTPPTHRHTTESTTDGTLVVLDADDPESTLQAALRDTDPTQTTYHLLLVVPTSTYEAKRRALADAGVPQKYTIRQAEAKAARTARRVGRDFLGQDSASFEVTGTVGREREAVRQLARRRDFTEIFVPHRERSLLQRLLGGEALAATLARTLPEDVAVAAVDSVAGSSDAEPKSERTFESRGDPSTGSN